MPYVTVKAGKARTQKKVPRLVLRKGCKKSKGKSVKYIATCKHLKITSVTISQVSIN